MLNDENFNPGRLAILEHDVLEGSLRRTVVECVAETRCGGGGGIGGAPAQIDYDWVVRLGDSDTEFRTRGSRLHAIRGGTDSAIVTRFLASYIMADLGNVFATGGQFVLEGRPDIVLTIGPLTSGQPREYSVTCRNRNRIQLTASALTSVGLRALCDRVDESWDN